MSQHSQANSPMGPGAEFDSIREMLAEWGEFAEGIGDDAAVLSVPAGMHLLVSTDAAVEDVHFRRKWISARDAGARAAVAAFSDLAAMGASASSILVSLIVPVIWREHIHEFSGGIKATVAALDARIVGGNISRGSSFSCTLTVIGYAANPVRRSGAQIGDALYVTGKLGGPAAAVSSWERGDQPADWAKQRFLCPVARVREGQWLAQEGAHAMIDISDGLAADARHLGAASTTLCVLHPELVPRFETVSARDALTAGEEYELLVALPAHRANEIAARFRSEFEVEFTLVGVVEAAQEQPARVELAAGHDHFSSR